MSVLIKGMDMPKEGKIIVIYKLNGQFYASMNGTELCPLVEIPTPHGRLIDADQAAKQLVETMKVSYRTKAVDEVFVERGAKVCIGNAPTVIESEE